MKKNWKKYALGAAAVGAGTAIAKPELLTKVGNAAGTSVKYVGDKVGLDGSKLATGVQNAGAKATGYVNQAKTFVTDKLTAKQPAAKPSAIPTAKTPAKPPTKIPTTKTPPIKVPLTANIA